MAITDTPRNMCGCFCSTNTNRANEIEYLIIYYCEAFAGNYLTNYSLITASTRHRLNFVSMLVHHLRLWPSINTPLGERVVFAVCGGVPDNR